MRFSTLATIPGSCKGGDLNQRVNIWSAGWHAFARAPLFGSGAGTLSPLPVLLRDTAHNTVLSIAVGAVFAP